MRIARRLGASLLALAIAAPAASATITPASAQSLIDTLFRNPAKRKRSMRDRQLQQQNRRVTRRAAPRREVRRKRSVSRRTAQRAATARVQRASAKPRQQRSQQRGQSSSTSSAPKIEAPTFFDYRPEQIVTVDMAPVAMAVMRELEIERAALSDGPLVRQLPERRAAAPRPLSAMTARAMLMPKTPASEAPDAAVDPAGAINASVAAMADDPLDDPLMAPPTAAAFGLDAPAEATDGAAARTLDDDAVTMAVNSAAAMGEDGSLDGAPVFEVLRDPRLDQIAAAETMWDVFGRMSGEATEPVAYAVLNHYEATRETMWTDGRTVRPAAREMVRTLREAGEWGLDASHYRVPPVPGRASSLEDHLAFELALTVAAAQYVKDAAVGRVIADGLSGYHDLPRRMPDLEALLGRMAAHPAPAELLIDAHPDTREFAALKGELARLRTAAQDPLPTLPAGTIIRAGAPNPNAATFVEILRRVASAEALDEHREALAAYDGGDVLPPQMDGLIRAVQGEKGLRGDGIAGPRTMAKLVAENPASKIERVELAMERSRWLPHEFGGETGEYVMINSPAYRVQHVKGDRVDLSMRVVVGKTSNQTNFFYDRIKHIEFNPDWAVPRSIIVNEYLPKLRSNPGWLDNKGWTVRDASGRQVRSSNVNWGQYGANVPYSVVQPSSSSGALGALKIEFPNRHAIYMHDTPEKSLFSRATRAYSHGCVRLAEPRRMAAAMLGTSEADVNERIRTGGHHNAKVTRDIPVYISYFTAWPTDSGEIGYYADVYGRDGALKTAMAKTQDARRAEPIEWRRIPMPEMRSKDWLGVIADGGATPVPTMRPAEATPVLTDPVTVDPLTDTGGATTDAALTGGAADDLG